MALGLPDGYTDEMCDSDSERVLNGKSPAYFEYAWDAKLITQICEAKGITRERFIRSMTAPKPSRVQGLVYYHELQDRFGDISDVKGFEGGPIQWPNGWGAIVPIRENGEIVELKFYRLRELLKPKQRSATAG